MAGLDASRQSLSAAQSAFQASGRQVGTAPTVMAAIDVNSAARQQNNLAWNAAIGSTNLWVTALNAQNLARISDRSRVARAMRMTSGPASSNPTLTTPGAAVASAANIR